MTLTSPMTPNRSVLPLEGDVLAKLRELFPDGKASPDNFLLFSTSGIHGSCATIEDIETGLVKYGEDFVPDGIEPDDWHGNELTVLVVLPRAVNLYYGLFRPRLSDMDWLKGLRASSQEIVAGIGAAEKTPSRIGQAGVPRELLFTLGGIAGLGLVFVLMGALADMPAFEKGFHVILGGSFIAGSLAGALRYWLGSEKSVLDGCPPRASSGSTA